MFEKEFEKNADDSIPSTLQENLYDIEGQEMVVIKTQIAKIENLESQLHNYSTQIDHLEIKAKQADLYKQQNENFKKQIEAFETKIKLENDDKKYKNECISNAAIEHEERVDELYLKLQKFKTQNYELQSQNRALLTQNQEIERTLTKKHKDLQEITKQNQKRLDELHDK